MPIRVGIAGLIVLGMVAGRRAGVRRIMAFMCKDLDLDTELFRHFLQIGVRATYADRFLSPAQVDTVDMAALEALLPAAPAGTALKTVPC